MTFALTKIQPPRPRAAAVDRAELESRLAAALAGRRAVLVLAPAGFGKTALVARALGRLPAGTGVAWIAADEGDDLERLVECILAALEPCVNFSCALFTPKLLGTRLRRPCRPGSRAGICTGG